MKATASLLSGVYLDHHRFGRIFGLLFLVLMSGFVLVGSTSADELKTVSGERLVGKTISINNHYVVFSSTSFGKVSLARSNVVALTLGSGTGFNPVVKTNSQVRAGASGTNSDITALLRSLPAHPELADSAASDLLAQAGPEATAKFNQMLRGLLNGSISVSSLRAEAKSVRDEARALRADLGDEAGEVLDGYIEILDKFLAQSPAVQKPATRPGR